MSIVNVYFLVLKSGIAEVSRQDDWLLATIRYEGFMSLFYFLREIMLG